MNKMLFFLWSFSFFHPTFVMWNPETHDEITLKRFSGFQLSLHTCFNRCGGRLWSGALSMALLLGTKTSGFFFFFLFSLNHCSILCNFDFVEEDYYFNWTIPNLDFCLVINIHLCLCDCFSISVRGACKWGTR